MTPKEIRAYQEKYEEYLEENVVKMQELIETGLAWHFEGKVGREAMSFLKCGACFLPETPFKDYYDNEVPSREWLKPGTTGTLENATEFWKSIKEEHEKEATTTEEE